MTLFDAIYARLTAVSAVTDIVGETGVWPITTGQGATAPYVIFSGSGSTSEPTHTEPTTDAMRLVQFACFASTPEAAITLRAAVVAALDCVRLSNGDSGTLEDDNRDDYDDAARLYRADADMLF